MKELKILKERLANEKDETDSIICCIEEMSELTKVLTKYLRNSSKFSRDNLKEEIAHVHMMVECIENIFCIPKTHIEKEQLSALKRYFDKVDKT